MTDSRPDPEAMLRQIKQLHGMKQDGVCITCGMNWPCDAAKLVEQLAESQKRVERLEKALSRIANSVNLGRAYLRQIADDAIAPGNE